MGPHSKLLLLLLVLVVVALASAGCVAGRRGSESAPPPAGLGGPASPCRDATPSTNVQGEAIDRRPAPGRRHAAPPHGAGHGHDGSGGALPAPEDGRVSNAVDLPNKETGTCARSCPVLLLDRWQVHLHDL